MKISYNWLKQFIKLPEAPEATGELLTDLGLEVEGLDGFQSIKGGLEGIVVGHVLECKSHPNADKLQLTNVDLGNGEQVQIVCGAPNIAAGQMVPVATIGTTLYDENGEAWPIKKGKIRGEASFGMICSEKELGLGQSHEGIMVMKDDLIPGTPVAEIFEVENDQVFEIGLTPNRADAMSHWGVARDLKAGYTQQGKNLELITPSVSSFHVDNRSLKIQIQVEDSALAPRYCGVTISGLKVEESPKWLQNRLKAIGLGPKNNVVDATNYVMHELGQPLHAFDAGKITGNEINVKTLEKGTKFTTLDDVERELNEEDLMICDAEKPLCIAGVFGGASSGVTSATTQIFLESAYFNPVNVRKTAKRHALNTDASFRFERGIDPNITEYALKRAVLLITEIAGGEVTSDIDDLYPKKIEDFQVFLTFDKVNKLIGENLQQETIKSILASLEIRVNNVTETGMGLTIPSYRVDVQREADVIEEILRVYGYNNIKFGEKLNASVANSSKFEDYRLQNLIANQLVGQGFYETMANSLTTPAYTDLSEQLNASQNVKMLNPLSQDLSVLRQSMLYSGLESVSYNINRKRSDLKLFEFGKTYHDFNGSRVENKHLSIFISGNRNAERWNSTSGRTDFFLLKGVIQSIFQRLGIENLKPSPVKSDVFSEGLIFSSAKNNLVAFGVIRKKVLKHFDIEQEVLYADFNWDALLEVTKARKTSFSAIPKYPAVRRDFALLLNNNVSYEEIEQIALKTEKKLLKEVDLFDVYQGNNLPEGKKSYAVSFKFQDENKTLTDKQVDKMMKKLQHRFEEELQAELR
ncbi:phenylalanine--tRNA ligase subunit beta [Salegentibacter salarius]|uniref:Phenylalanine--tRNA ligase beta subunit n=1 Tax=Salegentibacter salarius TaxID=435906 RepID=A0A2N0U0S8_9FLAO|nr:phenylalanine--tRNA ligase subunit beta [Salegentibacter salarius]OEY73450.1 phenylalanine--tRNA ligase subunit beta [Salegentibacter salarius]PKD20488.1 phenylalanine--tRNA ligase subunit beta [Salegentibacter salarius]SLJ96231.1 phenylalanyl-tRNA synthetase beta subunit [Salegentibacter salarius]